MRMEMTIGAKLQQKLKLAPQIIQSIEILQMNVTDLRQHVEEQMLENPTMEMEDPVLANEAT
ncbi:MAG: RNA polymerase sigma-54 factor, partial [Planctomycetota bacterium]|nr:RNA polymerase sigma-54 factor [Planctomycetota bacterium]